MPKFVYTVVVEAATEELADRVMTERIEYDEDLGFEYTVQVEYNPVEVAQ